MKRKIQTDSIDKTKTSFS